MLDYRYFITKESLTFHKAVFVVIIGIAIVRSTNTNHFALKVELSIESQHFLEKRVKIFQVVARPMVGLK